MKNRFISLICICSLLMSMLFVVPVGSAEINADEMLSWDFETAQDVSYLADIKKYTARDVDTFQSGAWNTQVKNTQTVQSLAPHRVKFENIGRSIWGIVSNTDSYDDVSCNKTDKVSMTPGGVPLTNGGNYCAVVSNTEGTIRPEILAMTIQLRDNQIEPGRKYKLDFDVLASIRYNGGNILDLHRAVWAGFGKPSERITKYDELPKWFVNAKRVKVETSSEEIDDNMAKGSKWLHASCEVTADELQFENGVAAFYIGINRPGEELYAAEKVYFDNITLTPIEECQTTVKTTYGYLWNMEDDINDWTMYSGLTASQKKVADIAKTNSASAESSVYGLMAKGSSTEIGAGVDIEDCEIGEYQLYFYAASDSQGIEFYAGEKGKEIKVGDGGAYWGYYSVPVSVGTDGALNLNIYAKSKTSGTSITNVYLDDVKLVYTGTGLLVKKGEKIPFFNEVKKKSEDRAMVVSALYEKNKLVSIKLEEGAVDETYFSQSCVMEIPRSIKNPNIRMFLWDSETMKPYNKSYYIGESYTEQTSTDNATWYAMWNYDKTAVEVTFEEKASDNNSSWYLAEVYSSDTLLGKAEGKKALRIESPYVDNATVRLLKYNRENNIAEIIGTYTWTNFVDKASEAIQPMTYKKKSVRAAFENETFDRLTLNALADYDSTDEVTAHSGRYSMKIFNRMGEWTLPTIQINTNELNASATLNISCYVKKHPDDSETWFAIQSVIPMETGIDWKYHDIQTIRDSSWHKLEATVNLADYKLKADDKISIRISTGADSRATSKNSFYLDDFVIMSDRYSGELYDDMHHEEVIRNSSLSATAIAPTGKYLELQNDIPVLKDVYKDYFKIGATTWMEYINGRDNQRFGQLIPKHFNSISDNGAFKSSTILKSGSRTDYDFSQPDSTMMFAQKNGITDIVGHTLICEGIEGETGILKNSGGTNLSRDAALSFMKEYITKVIKHFEGDGEASEYAEGADYSSWHISTWDVVNEAVAGGNIINPVKYKDYGAWYNIIGKEYIKYAFDYADEVCDENNYSIKLRYNDFAEQTMLHRYAVRNIVRDMKNSGYRVDSIGSQCHFTSEYDTDDFRETMELYSSLGVTVDASEIDVTPYTEDDRVNQNMLLYENGIPKDKELVQANILYDVFGILKEYKDIVDRATFWTYYDGISWWNDRGMKHTDYAGIFDRNYQAKPLFWAVADPEYYQQYYMSEEYLTSK